MTTSDSRELAPSRIIVTLVHGTWARKQPSGSWFEDGSAFVQTLRLAFEGVDLRLVPFSWTGKNSIYARRDGAAELAKVISSSIDQFPDDQHLVIAHSHGGNVALKALDIIGPKARHVRLVAVATPFLQIYRNSLSNVFRLAWIAICLPWLLLGGSVTGYFGFIVSLGLRYDGGAAPFFSITFAIGLLITILAAIPIVMHSRSLISSLRGSKPSGGSASLAEAANYTVISDHVLVTRGVYDEASTALGIGALAAVASRAVSRMLPWSAGVSLAYGLISASIAFLKRHEAISARYKSPVWYDLPTDDPVLFMLKITGGLLVISLAVFVLKAIAAAGRLAFGRELFFASETYEVDVSNVPNSSENLTMFTLDPGPTTKGLRHGLYSHPFFPTAVAKWFSYCSERSRT